MQKQGFAQDKVAKLRGLLEKVLLKLKRKHIVLLFSGGIDSTVLAKMLKLSRIKFSAVTVGTADSQDIKFAKLAAKDIGIKLKMIKINESSVKRFAKIAVKLLGPNPVYVSIAIPAIAALQGLKGKNTIVTGLGSDELFAGYQSHQNALERGYAAVQEECHRRINVVKGDVRRDKKLAKNYKQQIYLPFLEPSIIDFGLKLEPELKISKKERKIIVRLLAKELGLPVLISNRPKKAVQYGSGAQKMLEKIAKKEGFCSVSVYLRNLYKLITA